MWEDLPHTLLQFKTSTGVGVEPRTLIWMGEEVNKLISPYKLTEGAVGILHIGNRPKGELREESVLNPKKNKTRVIFLLSSPLAITVIRLVLILHP